MLAAMQAPVEELAEFPHAGARARTWRRFERDLAAWLESPQGRFALWQAAADRAAAGSDTAASQ
jgi:hypothetical protein